MAIGMKSMKTLQMNLSSFLIEIGMELVKCRQTMNLNSLQVKDPTQFCDRYLDKPDTYSSEEECEGVMVQPFGRSMVPHDSTQA